MSVNLHPPYTILRENIDGAYYVAALQEELVKRSNEILETFRIYQAVASRIVTDRKLVAPETNPYCDWTTWGGLYVVIHLRKEEGFDAMFDYYEWLSFQTSHARVIKPEIYGKVRKTKPDPEDCPEIRRRAWTFQIGSSRCTLAAFADTASEICKVVEVGTKPKFEMICGGSPLPMAWR